VFAVDWRRRSAFLAGIVLAVSLAAYGLWRLDFSLSRLGSGVGQIAHMVSLMFPPSPGGRLPLYLQALAETLAIALLGTLTAAVLAFPVGFLAAKNVVPNIFAHFAVRRVLDVFRGVDVLIWALIFVNVVGLGPFAGMLAIAAADFGSFGKLFSEAIEAADKRPTEGVVASGGTQLHALRFALIPQVFPVIASQVLYYFESNSALRHHHRHRRRRWHRPLSCRADSRFRVGRRGLPRADDPHCSCHHRLGFEPPALGHHWPGGSGPLNGFNGM
jgi:phosphonate transport system permease protein